MRVRESESRPAYEKSNATISRYSRRAQSSGLQRNTCSHKERCGCRTSTDDARTGGTGGHRIAHKGKGFERQSPPGIVEPGMHLCVVAWQFKGSLEQDDTQINMTHKQKAQKKREKWTNIRPPRYTSRRHS
jgi:hypothetical protein